MGVEIERKFLVNGDSWRDGATATEFRQGYLSRSPGRTVRVRIAGQTGVLTIKGKSQGISRPEFEYQIPLDDAVQLLALCEGPAIEKVRHEVAFGGFVWEVDEFRGANAGLVVAEIELPAEDTTFALPPWIGQEVTSDSRYANSRLAEKPYSTWKK